MNRLLNRLLVAMMLGVAVYAAFAVHQGVSTMGERLARFSWGAFFAACGLAGLNYALRFARWEFYLARLSIRGVPKLDSFLTFLSGFVLTVTPGKVGEVFKSLVLFETQGVPLARTAPIVVAERLTDVIGVVVLIVIGSAGFPGGLGWAIAGAIVVVVALVVIASPRLSAAVVRAVERAPGRVGKLGPKVHEAWESLRTMTTPGALVVPTLVSIVAWACEGLALWVILHGFEQTTPVPVAMFFYATATLAGALVPVPGGLGITEGALQQQLMRLGGVERATSASAMILVRFATLWFAVLVGFIALAALRARFPKLLRGDTDAAG